jgi:hypothetical protein
MARNDGRAVARENEHRILRALNRFGWLRTRDLGALVFTKWASKPPSIVSLAAPTATASALRMAQRTLRRMRDARLVLQSDGPDGSVIYAVSEGGARLLGALGFPASSGKDLVRSFSAGYFRHRCIANELAIVGVVQGLRVSTEREIARGLWAGGEAGIAGKRPDALWRDGRCWTWIEVERSRRNAKDYAQLVAWLLHLRTMCRPGSGVGIFPGSTLARVVFVCTPAFQVKLSRDLLEKKFQRSEMEGLISFETSLYKFQNIFFN